MVDWPPDLHRALLDELAPGEHVEWRGRPDPIAAALVHWALLPFGGLCLVMSASGFIGSLGAGDAGLTLVTGVFTAFGAFLVTRPLAEWHEQQRVAFAITDRRLIVVRKSGRSVTSVLRSGIRQVERVRTARGLTLRIPTQTVDDSEGGRTVHHIALHGVHEGERAYRLLTQAAGVTD